MYYFFDSSKPETITDPYYDHDKAKIGVKQFYTRTDIEIYADMQSTTLKNKILKLTKGKEVKIGKIHSIGNLMLKRLSDDEETIAKEILSVSHNEKKLREEIYIKTKPEQIKLRDLGKERKTLQKKIKFKVS